MVTVLIFLSVIVTGLIILIKPKWGTFLIWFILFTYPHSFWFYRRYLPLNIGFDDLFCIMLFLMVLIRRNILGGVPIRFGYAFWVVTLFSIIAAVAIFNGSRYAAPAYRILYVKDILKLGVYWCLFYAILHCIDDERDLKMQFSMFSIATAAGAIIVVLQYFRPYLMVPWTSPRTIELFGALEREGRAYGAFLHPNAAACVLVCSLILVTTAIRLQKRLISKIIVYSFIFILLTGVLLTKSRAGLMALVGTFVLMAFRGKNKKVAWFIIIAAVIVGIYFAGIKEAFEERVVAIYDPISGQWGKNVVGRVEIWAEYFKTATPRIYLLGQGSRQSAIRNLEAGSHSVYVEAITVYGIAGFLWAVISIIIFFLKARSTRYTMNPLIQTVSAGCMWALLAWGIYGIAAEALSSQYSRYLLFYLVVLVDRANFIAQQQQWQLYGDEYDFADYQLSEIGSSPYEITADYQGY